jgi:Zn finger protein HypA/HybF involved in hydrogenase expression
MIRKVPQLAFNNKEEIAFSKKAGCYHCLELFETKEIKEYTDEEKTAICPKCHTDTVLAETVFDLSKENLKKAKEYWFK